MYKIMTKAIQDFLDNPDNFTTTERDMVNFLLNSLPETILVYRDESGEYIENQSLIQLVLAMGKVLGGSRELILNLKNAHHLPTIIDNILRANKEEGSVGGSKDNLRLRDNNKRLLALKAGDVGFNIDFTKLTTEETNQYLEEIESYFGFIEHKFSNTRNRGSNAALYQIIRGNYRMDKGLDFDKIEILEQGTVDTTYQDLDQIKDEQNNPLYRHIVGYGTDGVTRIHFKELTENYGDTRFMDYDHTFDYKQGLFYLNPNTPLYQQIMDIKPAGIFYEMIVKASLYIIYTDDSRVVDDNKSYIVELDGTKQNYSNGYRELKEIVGTVSNHEISFVDNITTINSKKIEADIEANIDYDIQLDIKRTTESDNETTETRIKTNDGLGNRDPYNYDETASISENVSQDLLKEIKSTITVIDKFNHLTGENGNRKVFTKTQVIPEKVFENKMVPTIGFSVVPGISGSLTASFKNNHKRQSLTKQTHRFHQSDYFVNKDGSDDPIYTKESIVASPTAPGTSIGINITNTTDKAWHGQLNSDVYVERDYDSNKNMTFYNLIDETVKIQDKFGREDFELIIETMTMDDNYTLKTEMTNPNNFEVGFNFSVEWQYLDGSTWKKDTTANGGVDINDALTIGGHVEHKQIVYSIKDGSGEYAKTNRDKGKRVKVSIEITSPQELTGAEYSTQFTEPGSKAPKQFFNSGAYAEGQILPEIIQIGGVDYKKDPTLKYNFQPGGLSTRDLRHHPIGGMKMKVYLPFSGNTANTDSHELHIGQTTITNHAGGGQMSFNSSLVGYFNKLNTPTTFIENLHVISNTIDSDGVRYDSAGPPYHMLNISGEIQAGVRPDSQPKLYSQHETLTPKPALTLKVAGSPTINGVTLEGATKTNAILLVSLTNNQPHKMKVKTKTYIKHTSGINILGESDWTTIDIGETKKVFTQVYSNHPLDTSYPGYQHHTVEVIADLGDTSDADYWDTFKTIIFHDFTSANYVDTQPKVNAPGPVTLITNTPTNYSIRVYNPNVFQVTLERLYNGSWVYETTIAANTMGGVPEIGASALRTYSKSSNTTTGQVYRLKYSGKTTSDTVSITVPAASEPDPDPLPTLSTPNIAASATCTTTGYESNPTYTFRIAVTNTASVQVRMYVSIGGVWQNRLMNGNTTYTFTRSKSSPWGSETVEAYATATGYEDSETRTTIRSVSCPTPDPDPQPGLTWQYNGTSSQPFGLDPGFNMEGTTCFTEGATEVVTAESVGRSGGYVELICKL